MAGMVRQQVVSAYCLCIGVCNDIFMYMNRLVRIIGGGLAGSEAALWLADMGVNVELYEMRPHVSTAVHRTGKMAELVCSNSLKSFKSDTAAGMLKTELDMLGSRLFACALETKIDAGGALAVDRDMFSDLVTNMLESNARIDIKHQEVTSLEDVTHECDALLVATGPLTSDSLADKLKFLTGSEHLAFYDAAAPIVMADSIDNSRVFRQSRYVEEHGQGDYLNCPFTKSEYDEFIDALIGADRVVKRDFETSDLFQACQPIEEIARKGVDAPRFGAMKPVGLTDPVTGKRPWAAVQLRAENAHGSSFNLVGFQTNLTFPEQKRVFRMIPGLENAEFARYGVMHRNTYVDAPRVLRSTGQMMGNVSNVLDIPVYIAGQLAGTEGYCEAMRSGINAAISISAQLKNVQLPKVSVHTVFGALIEYATNPSTKNYQPMHVNFGIMEPLQEPIRNKSERYAAYAQRGKCALEEYIDCLKRLDLFPKRY